MTVIKENVIQMIQSMPEDISLEDIMAELYFRYQVDEGLRQLDQGEGIPHDEVEKRLEKRENISKLSYRLSVEK